MLAQYIVKYQQREKIMALSTKRPTKTEIEALGIAHSSTTGQTTDDHHPQSHTIASHDTTGTGAELTELTGGGNTTLHTHAESPVLFPFELGENLTAGEPVYIYSDSGAKIKKVYSSLANVGSNFRGYYHHSCMINTDKVVVVFRDLDNSSYPYVVCGEIQPDLSINWGTKVRVFTNYAYYLHIDKVDTDKFVVVFRGTGSKGSVKIGTVVSGVNIIIGAEYSFTSGYGYDQTCCYVSTDKFCVSYRDSGLMNHGYCRIGTCTGTDVVTWGTALEHGASSTYENWVCVPDPVTEKIAVFYRRSVGTTLLWCRSSLVSGTTLSGFGTETQVGNYPYYTCAESINTDKVAVAYRDTSDGNKLKSIVVTFTGTTVNVTLGDVVTLDSSMVYYTTLCKLADDEFVVAWMRYVSPYDGRTCKCSASGTTISKGADQIYDEDRAYYSSICRLSNTKYFLVWYSYANAVSNYIVVDGELNLLDYTTGILKESGSLGETKNIDLLGGITSQLSGMTPGDHQYIQNDATISSVLSNYHIGIALSSTSMLIVKVK